jgi:hypothetical protein
MAHERNPGSNSESDGSVADLLKHAEPPVRYDVERGYARHLHLRATGAALPDWANEPAVARPSALRRWGGWLVGGFLLGALGTVGLQRFEVLPSGSNLAHSGGPRSAEVDARTRSTASTPGTQEPAPSADQDRTGMGGRSPARTQGSVATEAASEASPRPVPALGAVAPTEDPSAHPAAEHPGLPAPSDPQQASAAIGREPSDQEQPTGRVRVATSSTPGTAKKKAAEPLPLRRAASKASRTSNAEIDSPLDRAEVDQLARAEHLLARDPHAALLMVRDGHLRFKNGYLRHERRYIEVMALFAMKRTGEAHAHAQWFLRDYRTSPYREQVQRAIEQHPLP